MTIRYFAAAVILLSLGALGYLRLAPKTSDRKEENARNTLAFESLTDRLPKGKSIPPIKALDEKSTARWQEFDQSIRFSQGWRADLLKEIHEKTSKFFVESPGQGPSRYTFTPEMVLMDDYWRPASDLSQPGDPLGFPYSPGAPLARMEPMEEFHSLHRQSMWNFLYPTGFGYVKDRANVAGFKSHGFRALHNMVNERWRWRVQHIQLVGILRHEEPVVYLTDKLPSMEQIRQGKTRTLDDFERAALGALCEGDDQFIAIQGDSLRMFGALRATQTCLQCHDANVGDLLGAFSYSLRLASSVNKVEER